MNAHEEYCIACGHDGPLHREQKATEFAVRGETLRIIVPVKICPSCGVTEAEGVDPAEIAFSEYRKLKGLLTPEAIRKLRERYKLSQKSLAALLGMSEATINRYEGGGLQDEAHDAALRACESPEFVRGLLERSGHRLSAWQRQRVEAVLECAAEPPLGIVSDGDVFGMPRERSAVTGYRHFEYPRYLAVVVWLTRHVPVVTATSLNKLLFYVDHLHCKSEAVSLTGAAYRRVQHGPVPAAYGDLQQRMELEGFIDVQEVQYKNGRTGLEIRPGPKADTVDLTFSPRELTILEAVAATFKTLTPTEIRDRSHAETAWKDTEDRTLISYDKAPELSLPIPA
jgi:putative zinc finger/helix-turn-helix YgiT family protein